MNRITGNRAGLGSCVTLALALYTGPGAAVTQADDWPAWVDDAERLRQQIADVNEGELDFLPGPAAAGVHHHASRVVISEQSLHDGWIVLEQCHVNLDRVAAAQILFNPTRSRNLEVVSFDNVGAAFVEANTVQLRDIRPASRVCIRSESQALHNDTDDVFELQNGPFMRRFLDGYYPLQLTLDIEFPASLTLADFSPAAQPGFAVTEAAGRVHVEALFEGRLRTRFRFFGR